MAVIDELVTMLRYEIAAGTEASIERFQKGLAGADSKAGSLGQSLDRTERKERAIDKTTRMLNTSWEKTSKGINTAKKAAGGLATGFKTLGAVSMVTSGLMAAWGINAAKGASQINKMGYSLQLSTDQVQEMGGVYEELGGTMQDFANDAANYRAKTGRAFDFDAMKRVAAEMRGMTESQALFWGQAQGFTDTGILAMHKYINSIEEMVEKKRGLGHFTDPKDLENLKAFNVAWADMSKTVSGLSTSFQSGLAGGGLTDTLGVLTEALAKNMDAFKSWGDALGNTIGNLTDGAAASFERLTKLMDKERTPEAVAVMTSPDADVRKENIERLQAERDQKTWGNRVALAGNIGKAMFTGTTISDAIDSYSAAQEIIENPLETAKHFDVKRSRGDDAPTIDAAAAGILEQMSSMMMIDSHQGRSVDYAKAKSQADQLAESIVSRRLLPDWLSIDKKERRDVIQDAYSGKDIEEIVSRIGRIDALDNSYPPVQTVNNQTTNTATTIDKSLHTTEQSPADAAAATVSEFSGKDFLPESEMDKKHFQPEQVAEMVREKSEPVPPSMLFGNASPNVKVQIDSPLMPALPSRSLQPPQSSRPELSRNADGSVTIQHAAITINAPTGDGNDIHDVFTGGVRNLRNNNGPTTAFAARER